MMRYDTVCQSNRLRPSLMLRPCILMGWTRSGSYLQGVKPQIYRHPTQEILPGMWNFSVLTQSDFLILRDGIPRSMEISPRNLDLDVLSLWIVGMWTGRMSESTATLTSTSEPLSIYMSVSVLCVYMTTVYVCMRVCMHVYVYIYIYI